MKMKPYNFLHKIIESLQYSHLEMKKCNSSFLCRLLPEKAPPPPLSLMVSSSFLNGGITYCPCHIFHLYLVFLLQYFVI